MVVLVVDDAFEVERAGDEEDAEDGDAQRDFVADELGAGAEGAEEAVLVVGRPAAEDDGVDRQAADGEDVDDADVDVRGDDELHGVDVVLRGAVVLGKFLLERRVVVAGGLLIDGLRPRVRRRRRGAAERHDGEGQQGGRHRDGRGDEVEQLVHLGGDDLFLEDELESVGDGLEQAPGADAVGADAVLRPGGDLALQQHQIGARALDDAHHDDDDDQGDPEVEVGVHREPSCLSCLHRQSGRVGRAEARPTAGSGTVRWAERKRGPPRGQEPSGGPSGSEAHRGVRNRPVGRAEARPTAGSGTVRWAERKRGPPRGQEPSGGPSGSEAHRGVRNRPVGRAEARPTAGSGTVRWAERKRGPPYFPVPGECHILPGRPRPGGEVLDFLRPAPCAASARGPGRGRSSRSRNTWPSVRHSPVGVTPQ